MKEPQMRGGKSKRTGASGESRGEEKREGLGFDGEHLGLSLSNDWWIKCFGCAWWGRVLGWVWGGSGIYIDDWVLLRELGV